jgi:hypothetical protein
VASLVACGASRPSTHGPRIRLEMPALDGGTIQLNRYAGRPVVLHVFAVWDIGSQGDVELLQELWEKRNQEIHIIGLALDEGGYELVSPWRKALGARYLVGLATDDIRQGRSSLGKIKQVPQTLILDCRLRLHRRIVGPLTREELTAAVASASSQC